MTAWQITYPAHHLDMLQAISRDEAELPILCVYPSERRAELVAGTAELADHVRLLLPERVDSRYAREVLESDWGQHLLASGNYPDLRIALANPMRQITNLQWMVFRAEQWVAIDGLWYRNRCFEYYCGSPAHVITALTTDEEITALYEGTTGRARNSYDAIVIGLSEYLTELRDERKRRASWT